LTGEISLKRIPRSPYAAPTGGSRPTWTRPIGAISYHTPVSTDSTLTAWLIVRLYKCGTIDTPARNGCSV